MSDLIVQLAHSHVRSFADEVMADHREAMECWDCEEHLARGITAGTWVLRAEEVLREAHEAGLIDGASDILEVVCVMLEAWLVPVENTEQWVASLGQRGRVPENLAAFCDIRDQIDEMAQRYDWLKRARKARVLSQSGESW
jgi:hypothetical protein